MILIIDDDHAVLHSLALLLKQAGLASVCCDCPAEALARLDDPAVRLVIQDMNFSRRTSGEEGLQLLGDINARRPELPVILITAWGSIELAVEGMKAGAADFVTKPWRNEQVLQTVRTALNLAASGVAAASEEPLSRNDLDERFDFAGIIGRDPEFLKVLELAGRVAATDASVLITGDSGTGKEVIASALHRSSPRAAGPFIKVNLGGLSSTLFDSEMFGHVKGAFTDARRDREGRFAAADGGTILLDEIGELELQSQVKMLRVLQDRTFEVLGSSRTRSLDVRVISATNRDLGEAVSAGRFREDLLYRLNLITLHLPPLSRRRRDIPVLAGHFLARSAAAYGRAAAPPMVTPQALAWLEAQPWPGNVRQLEQFMTRAVLTLDGPRLDLDACHRVMEMEQRGDDGGALPPVGSMTMDEVEKAMIVQALGHFAGNISRAADSLGLSRAALYRRFEKHGIQP